MLKQKFCRIKDVFVDKENKGKGGGDLSL